MKLNEFIGTINVEPLVELVCNNCGSIDKPKLEYVSGNSSFKATCKACGKYIKFLAHKDIKVNG